MPNYVYDANHVRYELVSSQEGKSYNWLFIPGGPGGDSRYFHSLVKLLNLPGNVWLIDLPGNGDNIEDLPNDYNYDNWFSLFMPVVKRFENPIVVGHSFGGMFPLLFPELEEHVKGFVVLNSAPCLWLKEAVEYSRQFNLPDLSKEMGDFVQNPNDSTFKAALDACMPYYFPAKNLELGRSFMAQVPIRYQPGVWWQIKVLELNFNAVWVPQKVPTLIMGAPFDCMCPYYLFEKDERFQRPNIQITKIEGAGHFPWIDNPEAVKAAIDKFCESL